MEKDEKGWIDFVTRIRDYGKITIPLTAREAIKAEIGDIVRVRVKRVEDREETKRGIEEK